MHASNTAPPEAVLRAYGFAGARVTPITIGLINQTFRVDRADGASFAVQRLHPIFRAEVNLDLDAITRHVEARGLPTPRLVPTLEGGSWVEHEGVHRALTWLPGRVVARIESPAIARTAAALVGRFHEAVGDLEHRFHFTRPGAHDTAAHLARLAAAIERADGEVRPVAAAILEHGASREPLPETRARIVHGDPKITNVLLDARDDRAIALLDLDTLAHGTIPVELGDALRSWCNPAGENELEAHVDRAIFDAAIEGYAGAARGLLDPDEIAAIPLGLETIALELSSRFCLDAIEDRYFGWDPSRFPSRRAHNLVRARSQLALSRSARALRGELERRTRAAFA